MTGRAEIRLRGRGGMFVADCCRIEGPWIHAEGQWRVRLAEGVGWGAAGFYTWPHRAVDEVRWSTDERQDVAA